MSLLYARPHTSISGLVESPEGLRLDIQTKKAKREVRCETALTASNR